MVRIWYNMSIGLGLLMLAGCQQQMAHQPSYRPLRSSSFFADGMASRPLVKGTIARGQLKDDVHLHEGKWPTEIQNGLQAAGIVGAALANPLGTMAWDTERPLYADAFPMPIT